MKIIYSKDTESFKPSQKIQKLISFIESSSDTEITIKFSFKYDLYPNSAFYSEDDNGRITIHVGSNLFEDEENLEQSIVHEAGHALLSKVYKYPSIIINTDDVYKVNNINQIRNAIEDIIINILSEKYGVNSHGSAYYISLGSEINELENDADPYYEKIPELKESFIFSRIILALEYFHMIEADEEKRTKLQNYLEIMKKNFPEFYEDAEKCLFINENKSIIPKHRFKEAIEISLSSRSLIQFVTIKGVSS